MADPRILGPEGTPIHTPAEAAHPQDLQLSTDFSLQTGRGTVKLRLPVGNREQIEQAIAALEAVIATAYAFDAAKLQDVVTTLRGALQPKAYVMLPAEARIYGVQLITEAERAVCDAIFLRTAMELFGVPAQEAVQMLLTIGKGTRADHAMVYERMLAEAERAKKMQGATDGPPS